MMLKNKILKKFPIHDLEITFINNESNIHIRNYGKDKMDLIEMKNFIKKNSNKISFIDHKITYGEGNIGTLKTGLCNFDLNNCVIVPTKEEILSNSDINYVLRNIF